MNIIFTDGAGRQTPDLNNVNSSRAYDDGWLPAIPNMTKPVANFTMTPSTGNAPLTVNFNAQSSSGCGNLIYFWDFGNGNTSSATFNESSNYPNPGVYTVKLVVRDPNGESDSVTKTLTVNAAATGMAIHFKRPNTWTNVPRLYYWNTQPAGANIAWPGVEMTDIGNGWWRYVLNGVNCSNIIFNNNASPQTPDLNRCGDCWYDGGWVNAPTSVTDLLAPANAVKIYPNPVSNMVGLKNDLLANGNYTLRITDITGRIISTQVIRLEQKQTYWFTRERLQLNSGTMILQLIDSKGVIKWNGKVVAQ